MFKDSFRFLSRSLDSLSQSLDKNLDFKTLDREFGTRSDLLKRKGVFPYHLIRSLNDYSQIFPTRDDFPEISNADYDYAKRIYEEFQCNNLGEYSDLYLKTDVMILTDIFEKLRDDCLSAETYMLDPAQYLSAPSLSWDAMLKCTSAKIELISDLSMLAFVKRGVRGGVCQVSRRQAVAHNHYLEPMNDDQEQNYLIYLDKVNLYGSAMTGKMPSGNYKWEDPQSFSLQADATGSKGYIVEVDVQYDSSLHDDHNDLPFLPESFLTGTKEKRLCLTLHEKKNYIASLRNIQQAVRYGLKVTKLHKVLSFDQSEWLKDYIELNNRIRKNSTDPARKELAKLMNNAVSLFH